MFLQKFDNGNGRRYLISLNSIYLKTRNGPLKPKTFFRVGKSVSCLPLFENLLVNIDTLSYKYKCLVNNVIGNHHPNQTDPSLPVMTTIRLTSGTKNFFQYVTEFNSSISVDDKGILINETSGEVMLQYTTSGAYTTTYDHPFNTTSMACSLSLSYNNITGSLKLFPLTRTSSIYNLNSYLIIEQNRITDNETKSSKTIDTSKPFNVTVVIDESNMFKCYINGELLSEKTSTITPRTTGNIINHSGIYYSILERNSNFYLYGNKLYNKLLTPNEIKQIMRYDGII